MTDHDADWIPGLVGRLRVKPGSRVRLPAGFDPGATLGVRKKDDGLSLLRRGMALLAEYQERLAAQENYGVLVVLQALDAAGKDSTIRHVMSGVNPQGVKVSSFKAPSAEELSHDYLWRHARRLPARGEIGSVAFHIPDRFARHEACLWRRLLLSLYVWPNLLRS